MLNENIRSGSSYTKPDGFLDYLSGRSAVLASDPLRTQPDGSPIGLGPDSMVDGR
jgi:hypothetical protein